MSIKCLVLGEKILFAIILINEVMDTLAIPHVIGLELTRWGGDHEDGNIGLGGTSDHVLDESLCPGVSMMVKTNFSDSNLLVTFFLTLLFVGSKPSSSLRGSA